MLSSNLSFYKTEVRELFLPSGNYSLNMNASGRILIKELRVWREARSMLDIETYRWI
jgi:hypothetical protein